MINTTNCTKPHNKLLLALFVLLASMLPTRTAFASADDWVDIHIQVIEFTQLDFDWNGVTDFKFYIVAKFDNSAEQGATLTYPQKGSMRLAPDNDGFFRIETKNTGMSLSVPEEVETVTVEIIAVDSDAINFENPALNAAIDDALTQLPDWLASVVKNNKSRIIKFLGRMIGSLGAVAYDYIAEEDKLGVATLILSRQNGWIPAGYPVVSAYEPGPMTVYYEIRVAPAMDTTPPPATSRNTTPPPAASRRVWLVNHCPKPLRLSFQFYRTLDGWINTGWWEIAGDGFGYLQSRDAAPLQADSDTFYYYAELLDGSGYTWSGDVAIEVDEGTLPMREVVLTPGPDNDYLLTLDCDDLAAAALSAPVTSDTSSAQPPEALLSSTYMVEKVLFATTLVELLSSADPALLSNLPTRTPLPDEKSIDYLNALVEEVWSKWVGIANQYNIDPKIADVALYGGLSPARQLFIRMIQNQQQTLNEAEACALYHIFTIPEGATAPDEDINGIIYTVNESCF